jgi:hypothetical protein
MWPLLTLRQEKSMLPRKGSRVPAPTIDISHLEWRFDDCPTDELVDCLEYELAREVPWLREYVAAQNAEELKELAQATYCIFLVYPKWPANPYLSIELSKRRQLLRTVRSTIKEIKADFLLNYDVPKGLEKFLRAEMSRSGKPVIRSLDQRLEIALFRIDWKFSDPLLLQFFESYLKLNRPKQIKPLEHRAKNTPDAQRRQQLRKLGMFRLFRAHQFNGNATHKKFRTEFGRDGVPLKKVDSWYRARRNTEALLMEFENEIMHRFSYFGQVPKREMKQT